MDVSCGVCLKAQHTLLLDERLKLYKCQPCHHTITAHPAHDPELYSAYYYSKVHKNWFKNPNISLFRFIAKELRKLLGEGKHRILDVGCGNGDFLKFLTKAEPAWQLTGVDTVDNEHAGVRFFKEDFFHWKAGMFFDAVVTLTVIEHIEDGHLFLKKINDCLRPGGILVVTTNNNDGLFYKIARLLKRVGLRAAHDRIYSSHHVQHFSNVSLRLLLEKHGFEITRLKNHNYPLKAVDMPPAGFLTMRCYRLAVVLIFFLSWIFGNGFLQTYVCRRGLDRR